MEVPTVKEMNITELKRLKIRLNNRKKTDWNEACALQLKAVQKQMESLRLL